MPLVTVLLPESAEPAAPRPTAPAGTPAAVFAREAGIAVDLVTVSVVGGVRQTGNPYGAVISILIPDVWDAAAGRRFLTAAAVMAERCFRVAAAQSIVTISHVQSGGVLDRGTVETW